MSEAKTYVIDTNSLIRNPHIIFDKNVIITSLVLREIEELERRKRDDVLQYNIREAKRVIEDNLGDGLVIEDIDNIESIEGYNDDYIDNKIINYALVNGYDIITDDILLKHKAVSYGISVLESEDSVQEDYEGVKNFYYDDTDAEHVELMEKLQVMLSSELEMAYNPFGMKRNEYLVIWDANRPTYKKDCDGNKVKTGYKELGIYKFNGVCLEDVYTKNLKTGFMGEVKPRNVRQRLAFDLLQDESITAKALFGLFGAGKDFIMLSHAIQAVEEGKFKKIVWVRNNIEVKDTNGIGFLPDGINDKLKPFLAPMQDFLGDEYALDMFIEEGKVEVQHLGFIRGRDIKDSIIYVTECQSNTEDHIKLLLGRVGEGSQIWFNGDDQQADSRRLQHNNGVNTLKRLAGNRLYGQVTMDKTERSETARLASVLDNL